MAEPVRKFAPVASRRGGRPSLAESELIRDQILDIATALFLTHGYGATSIEAVAKKARMSKRTFYFRFRDKPALFGAVVHRLVERIRPPNDATLFTGGSFDEVLRRLAEAILRAALSPDALALYRVILAEATRFPELATVLNEQGTRGEAVRRIAELLEHEVQAGRLSIDNASFAAEEFLQIVVSVPQRRALGLGTPMTPAEVTAWAGDAVNLFLNGCRGWKRAAT